VAKLFFSPYRRARDQHELVPSTRRRVESGKAQATVAIFVGPCFAAFVGRIAAWSEMSSDSMAVTHFEIRRRYSPHISLWL
jgi:hypothetical protein